MQLPLLVTSRAAKVPEKLTKALGRDHIIGVVYCPAASLSKDTIPAFAFFMSPPPLIAFLSEFVKVHLYYIMG